MQDLEEFDNNFKPAEANGLKPGLEALPDGTYEFTIQSAELARTPEKKELILRMFLQTEINGTPITVERAYFFKQQQNVDYLGKDLVVLGFDADQWNVISGRRFSVELPKAVAAMPGLCFVGKKVTKDKHHNLYIQKRLASRKPPIGTVAESPPPAWNPPARQPGMGEEEIPF